MAKQTSMKLSRVNCLYTLTQYDFSPSPSDDLFFQFITLYCIRYRLQKILLFKMSVWCSVCLGAGEQCYLIVWLCEWEQLGAGGASEKLSAMADEPPHTHWRCSEPGGWPHGSHRERARWWFVQYIFYYNYITLLRAVWLESRSCWCLITLGDRVWTWSFVYCLCRVLHVLPAFPLDC